MKFNRGDDLTQAVRAVDLSRWIAAHYPESGVVPGKAGLYFASWRGNKNTPALSLSMKGGVWLWHDLASGEGGNVFDFLVVVQGMGRQEAAITLLEEAGIPQGAAEREGRPSTPRPLPQDAVTALSGAEPGKPKALAGRGFNAPLLKTYGIVAASDNPDDALIPIMSPEGIVTQVKRRIGNPAKGKYRYEHEGYGGPAWCSPGSRQCKVLYIIEGELNAIIAHAALQEAGERGVGVMGVAGAKNALYPGLCLNKGVFIYADDDQPGREALEAWAKAANEDGARSVHAMPALPMDFCDLAGKQGRPAVAAKLRELHHTSKQVFGSMDRMVGDYTVRELADAANRFISGAVINPTGIRIIDEETGGLPESGIVTICALSSIGKSALMRRFLLEHVRKGGSVKVYSPDQSTHAIYRLLASLLSGVGTREARSKRYSRESLEHYGTPEAALKAWKDAFEFVVMELSQRFVISEESDLREISKDMERARDQGVTMFGGDYIQLFETEGGEFDRKVVDHLKKLTRNLGVVLVAAAQLAKYKFPPARKSGIPYPGDIEGTGATWHASEMSFFLYNDDIYARKYAGPETQLTGDDPGISRLWLRKDKEGEGEGEYRLLWVPRLAALKDPTRPKVQHEQEGIM